MSRGSGSKLLLLSLPLLSWSAGVASAGEPSTAEPAAPVPAAAPPAPAPPAPAAPALGGALSLPEFIPLEIREPAAVAPTPTRTGGPGFLPAVVHVTVDPLMPQKYRSVPAGRYTCSVKILIDATGRPTDVLPIECDQESLWALGAAIVAWEYEPALQDGVPVASELPYTTEFEVKTLLPRKHVVGFIGLAGSAGGDAILALDGRVHLGEMLSFSGGVGFDQNVRDNGSYVSTDPTFHGDVAFSSPRQYFEHRGIFGGAVGLYGDASGQTGLYGGFRGELMTPTPGLSIGGDIGVATVWSDPEEDKSLGLVPQIGRSPFYPWLRFSLLWYAPVPRDQFVVVPRANDPVVYEAIIPEPPPIPDDDGKAFEGVPAMHWSKIPVAGGHNPVAGPGFAAYPPGSYTCNVRVLVGEDGNPKVVRAEKCPEAGRLDAEAAVRLWTWLPRPGAGDVQAVFPAPFYVERETADQVRVVAVAIRNPDGSTTPGPTGRSFPEVWVEHLYTPVFSSELRPGAPCLVDVDIDVMGNVEDTRWKSGEIDIRPRVLEALEAWKFYAVVVGTELQPVRVTLSMCNYPAMTTQAELDAARAARGAK